MATPLLATALLLLGLLSSSVSAQQLSICRLKNKRGMEVDITNAGASITRLTAPDRQGRYEDVLLGWPTLQEYLNTSTYFGSTIGRVANRIANATYTLYGRRYQLIPNNGPNTLHGGPLGITKRAWDVVECVNGSTRAAFAYFSPDLEQGFGGAVNFTATFVLAEDRDELMIEMRASTNQTTPINMANHNYWNLNGQASNTTVLKHVMSMPSSKFYTPVDTATLIPTGKITAVRGSPYDFLEPREIGARWAQLPAAIGGYDNNWVNFGLGQTARYKVRNGMASTTPKLACVVYAPATGRVLEVLTTAPGMQFYTSNSLANGTVGKGGAVYNQYGGLAVEAQGFPNAINTPNFPSTLVKPGKPYVHKLVYRLKTQG